VRAGAGDSGGGVGTDRRLALGVGVKESQSLEVILPGSSDLDALSEPAKGIILACERAKVALIEALEGNRIEEIIETKSQAEAIRVYTIQKQLGHDAELSAAEIVRRAQRCLGLAMRKGQAAGQIAKPGEKGAKPMPGGRGGKRGAARGQHLDSSKRYFQDDHERADAYAMSDDVTDKQFEKAVGEARAEGNLSRANVVRKVKGNGKGDRWAKFADLAADGHTSHQIAKKLGVHRETVLKKARECGVLIRADGVVGKSHIPKPDRILREFVGTLESLVPSCELIDISSLSPSVLDECVPILIDAMKALRKLGRRLKEVYDG
jgi:hypothetical protein